MTADQPDPTPETPSDPATPDPWPGDEPFTFTAEELEDIRTNGRNLSDVIASILTDLKLR